MRLHGRNVTLGFIGVGGNRTVIKSRLYDLTLLDQQRREFKVEVYGIERISSPIEPINITQIAEMFNLKSGEIK